MFGLAALDLGIFFAILALILVGIALLVSRWIPRYQTPHNQTDFSDIGVIETPRNEAIFLVQMGGRVIYSNSYAKEWFGFRGDEPNLERLAQRANPKEIFLGLCAKEGQTRFSIDGRLVEGVSYFVPPVIGTPGSVLVSLHKLPLKEIVGGEDQGSVKNLKVITEISQEMASSLELEPTISAILRSVTRLIPADFAQITLWDPNNQCRNSYQLHGSTSDNYWVERVGENSLLGQEFSNYLVATQEPLVVSNVEQFSLEKPEVVRRNTSLQSFLGIPLIFPHEPAGTLELGAIERSSFLNEDLDILILLAGQATIALRNVCQFQELQKQVAELTGLAKLTQLTGADRNPDEFFTRLVTAITPLVQVESVGLLIYDEARRRLAAQQPFIGIPTEFVNLYHATLSPGGEAEEILLGQQIILAYPAPEDARIKALALAGLIQAAGLRDLVLLPLISGDRSLGYLQVADKLDGMRFTPEDLRKLTIISRQAATVIENLILVKQSRERTLRAEALRRIASLTGSVATLDEILAFSLKELARLLRVDMAVILLSNESRAELRVHSGSLYGISPGIASKLGRVSMNNPEYQETVTGSQQTLFCDDVKSEPHLPPIYRLMADVLGLKSFINVPIIERERGIGEVMLGSQIENFFDPSDLILLTTVASQIAAAIEKSNLYTQTDESLQRRVEQLTALTRISRELNTNLGLLPLLQLVHDELLRTTHASCGTISLYDQAEDRQGERRSFIRVGDTSEGIPSVLETMVMAFEEPIIVSDYGLPIAAIGNVRMDPPHPGVVSSLIVPITYQEGIAGLIHMHASDPGHFDTTALEIAQTLATQAAIALGNASRYSEQLQRNELLARRVETIEKVMETARSLSPEQPLEMSLEAIAIGIQEATPFDVVAISIFRPTTNDLIQISGIGLPLETLDELRRVPLSWLNVVETLKDEYRFNHVYFIPGDGVPYQPVNMDLASTVFVADPSHDRHQEWKVGDQLLVVLNDLNGRFLGIIRVERPRDGMRPDHPTMETLEIFASQASLMIESYQKIDELHSEIREVQSELVHVNLALEASHKNHPILLQKDINNAITIRNLNERFHRDQVALNIADLVNQQTNRMDVLRVFGTEVLTWLNFSTVLVAETRGDSPHLLISLGVPTDENLNLDAFLGQRNPLKTTLQNGTFLHADNLDGDNSWQGSTLLNAIDAKAFVCLPIEVRKQVNAAVLMAYSTPMPSLTEEDTHLFDLLRQQVAITLENLLLLDETNHRLQELNLLLDFSQQLGSLEPLRILQSLVDIVLKAMPTAEAIQVAMWQEDQGCLVPKIAVGYSQNERMLEIKYLPGQALPGQAFQSGEAILVNEVDFSHHYNLSPEYLLTYRDATAGQIPMSSLVVPIQTSETKHGILVLDNFHDISVFSIEDQNLVTSLTYQTALSLENARLYQSAEQRAAQLMALTNVAATITSSLKTEDLISSLLGQARSIVPYDTGTLWLRTGDQLTIRATSGFMDSDERLGLSVSIEDSLLLKEMIETSRPVLVKDVRDDNRFSMLLEPLYFTWLGVPLISKGQVIGVLAFEKAEANSYSTENIQSAVTFAGQAAVALENAGLYEESIRRAGDLNEHSQRLTLLNRLSAELSVSLDLDYILNLTLRELRQAIHSDLVSAILFDTIAQPYLQVEQPKILETYPVPLPKGLIFERLRETLGIFTTDDARNETELTDLQEYLNARLTRSLLILPIITGSDLHGLLMVHLSKPYQYSSDEVELARTISNQAAVAIQNARLFQETERLFGETQKRSAELGVLFELGVNITQVLDQSRLVDETFLNVTKLLGADTCGLVLVESDDVLVLRALDKGDHVGPLHIARGGSSFSEHILDTGEPLIVRDLDREKEHLPVQGYTIGEQVKSWIGVPLVIRGVTIGVLSAQAYSPNTFGETQLRLLGQVGNQLAVALDNARLFENTQEYAADLALRVSERTKELETEHNRSQTLLRIITELSASLDQDMVLNHTLSILNETIGAEYSVILLLHPEKQMLYRRSSQGEFKQTKQRKKANEWIPGEKLANWVVTECQPVLIPDFRAHTQWSTKSGEFGDFQSGIAVPLLIGEESLGALLLFHRQANQFNPDMVELAQTAAKQIAVSINNTQLFNLIRDQAERLGELLRTQHVETSRSQAMLEAVADGVLVTDARGVITLFNASAEKILKLERSQILGQSLENFIGLFGKAAYDWVQTIQTWSENSSSYQNGESKSEQIVLDDQRVVSVHLSPVLLKNDFLGTVSIFQDITHLIELDRLKSEFVATVSHELRTPMTSIKGYVEILLMGAAGPLNDSQIHFLQVVKTNTERLAILVNDLLDISRIEAGRVILSTQPLEVRLIIQNSLDMINRRSQDDGRSTKIYARFDADLPNAYGDPDRVQQILDNLVQNAYQYTPDNGEILISAQVEGDMMRVDVQDNGIGIPIQDQPRVFERFFRGESPLVLATSGTGLGLSIVRHLVEMHRGKIWFESPGVPGLGSVFSFTIPLYDIGGVEDHIQYDRANSVGIK